MENLTNTNSSDSVVIINKSKLKWGIVGLVLLLIIGVFFFWEPFGSSSPKPKESFHRDEKTDEQILHKDYTYKVRQMLDSGMSVAEISRETGLRRDVIRKIKNGKIK